MFDNDYKLKSGERGIIVSIQCPKLESHSNEEKVSTSIDELKDLINTLEIEYLEHFVQNRPQVEAGSIIGTGKLKEIAEFAKESEATLLIFDLELTAGQIQKR